jgi:hypothetical protein
MTVHSWLAREASWVWPRMANHLWHALLFLLVAWVVATLLRRAPARLRYTVWLFSLARCAIPSLLLAWIGQQAGTSLSWVPHEILKTSLYPTVQLPSKVSRVITPISVERDVPAARFAREAEHSELYCLMTITWLALFFSSLQANPAELCILASTQSRNQGLCRQGTGGT